jgi:hypothetical protein
MVLVTCGSSVCQAEDSKRRGRVAAGMSQRGGEVGVAAQPQCADGQVAQAGHHPGGGWRGPKPGAARLLARRHPLLHGVLVPLIRRLGRAKTGKTLHFS